MVDADEFVDRLRMRIMTRRRAVLEVLRDLVVMKPGEANFEVLSSSPRWGSF